MNKQPDPADGRRDAEPPRAGAPPLERRAHQRVQPAAPPEGGADTALGAERPNVACGSIRRSYAAAHPRRGAHADERVGVMHLVDTLDAGGAERMAVNFVNSLSRDRYRACLCTTRRDGELDGLVAPDVLRLRLARRHRFDVTAFRRLAAFIKAERIQVLHAHGAAIFIAVAASRRPPYPVVFWHDHYGRHEVQERPRWVYQSVVKRCTGVIAVSEVLAAWARDRLAVPAERIWYLPNFVEVPDESLPIPELPARASTRIVCAANLRPQKDHPTLLRAMAHVRTVIPEAHLLLAGRAPNDEAVGRLRSILDDEGLHAHVTWLGGRSDLPAILRGCAVGVLSSVSEGLPLALLEYGITGLPVVATDVGQVADVLDNGRAGVLVPPGDSMRLADALLSLLRSPERRAHLGTQLKSRVASRFGAAAAMSRLDRIYQAALSAPPPTTAGLTG